MPEVPGGPLAAYPAGGTMRVELDRSRNVVLRQPRLHGDAEVTVTDIDALIGGLRLAAEYRDMLDATDPAARPARRDAAYDGLLPGDRVLVTDPTQHPPESWEDRVAAVRRTAPGDRRDGRVAVDGDLEVSLDDTSLIVPRSWVEKLPGGERRP